MLQGVVEKGTGGCPLCNEGSKDRNRGFGYRCRCPWVPLDLHGDIFSVGQTSTARNGVTSAFGLAVGLGAERVELGGLATGLEQRLQV